MRAGSSSSNGAGVPLLTAQKRQVRVQSAPININVAVPFSPTLALVRAAAAFANSVELLFFW